MIRFILPQFMAPLVFPAMVCLLDTLTPRNCSFQTVVTEKHLQMNVY